MQRIHQKALAVCLIPIYAEALRRCWEIYRQRPVYDPWRQARPRAAIALVQTPAIAAFGTSASARTIALGSNVTAGSNMVLALGGFLWNNANLPTVVDNLGNKWRSSSNFGTNSGSLNAQALFYHALNVTAGACTVTVTPQSSTYISMTLYEISGADRKVGPQSTRQAGGTGTTLDCGTIPVSWANSMVIVAYGQGTSGAATATAGSGYTLRQNQTNGSNEGFYVQDQLGLSSGAATALTVNTSVTWMGAAVSFRPAQVSTSTITLVQANGSQKNVLDAGSLTCLYEMASVTATNTLVAVVSGIPASTATYTVSDNINGAWTQAITATGGSNQPQAEIWYFPSSGAGTITVTLATSANSLLSLAIMELNGGGSSFNVSAHQSGTSTSPSSTAITIAANAIVIGGISTEETDDDEINPESGWTNIFSHGASTSALTWGRRCGIGCQILGDITNNTAGSYSATWTTYDGVHDGYTAVVASFGIPNKTPIAVLGGRFLDGWGKA